jgi:hypothetical protein
MEMAYLQSLQQQAEAKGKTCAVGALIVNPQGQVFG